MSSTDLPFRGKIDTPRLKSAICSSLCHERFLYMFMDTETYEQSTYEKSQPGSNADLLKENMIAKILIYEHKPITVVLLELHRIESRRWRTGVRGDTASRAANRSLGNRRHNQGALYLEIGEAIRA